MVYVVTVSHDKESVDDETRDRLLSVLWCGMVLSGLPHHLLFPGFMQGLNYNVSFIHRVIFIVRSKDTMISIFVILSQKGWNTITFS
jgi:hypothetical protein